MKYYFLFPLLFAFSLSVNAQSDSSAKASFGIRAGLNSSHPNFAKGSPPSKIETSWGTGVTGGVFLNVPISNRFSVQPEYLFKQVNTSIEGFDSDLKMQYLSLPVYFQFRIIDKLTVSAGPQFELLINAHQTTTEGEQEITHDTEERSIGASVGLSYQVYKSFGLSVHYMHGLNHIGLYQRTEVQEFKFESLQLTFSCQF